MVGFDDGTEGAPFSTARPVAAINPNLTAQTDVTTAKRLASRDELWASWDQRKLVILTLRKMNLRVMLLRQIQTASQISVVGHVSMQLTVCADQS